MIFTCYRIKVHVQIVHNFYQCVYIIKQIYWEEVFYQNSKMLIEY